MAKYVVTSSVTDDWGENDPSTRRFDTRGEADAFFAHENEMGRFVRLVYWHDHKAKEVSRANERPRPETA